MQKTPWKEIQEITKPTLIVYGEKDEYCYGRMENCVSLIKHAVATGNNFQFEIIPDADHGFRGKRQELAEKIVQFLQ
jgi:pimeloyl-ACP methyl ester carboxylesterase